MDNVGQSVAGLEEYLRARGLERHLEAASAWCEEMGAAFLEEVVANSDALATALGLSDADRTALHAIPAAEGAPGAADGVRACKQTVAKKSFAGSKKKEKQAVAPVAVDDWLARVRAANQQVAESSLRPGLPQSHRRFCLPQRVRQPRPASPQASPPPKLSFPGGRLQPRAVAPALAEAVQEAKGLVRSSTWVTAPPVVQVGALRQQDRTITSPVTGAECQLAARQADRAYVPLKAWPRFGAPASARPRRSSAAHSGEAPLTAQELLVEETEAPPNGLQRAYASTWRPPRLFRRDHPVPAHLLKARIPAPQEQQHPFQAELDEERKARKEEGARPRRFEDIRSQFMREHGPEIKAKLSQYSSGRVHFQPAPVSREVQQRFIASSRAAGDELVPVYHGSDEKNYSSICDRGLLIPGRGNELRIANGAAHGRGIYTARAGCPSLSMGFCTAPRLLVCGVLDDAVELGTSRSVRGRSVTAESEAVRHVGDAVVVFDAGRVVPLFEASAERFSPYRPVVSTNQATQSVSAVLGPAAPGTGGPAPKPVPKLVDLGKGKVYHVASRQTAWLPPQPIHADKSEIKQKRVYERRLRQTQRRELREQKAFDQGEVS